MKDSVIKMSFNSFCKVEAKTLEWKSVLMDLNKTVFEAYILANVHVIRLCKSVSEASTKSDKIKDDELRLSFETYKSWRPDGYQAASSEHLSAGWQNNISLQMATNIKNMVKNHFYPKFLKYLKTKHKLNGKEGYNLLKEIMDPKYKGNSKQVKKYKELIPPARGRIDSNPELALPILYKFNKYLELLTEDKWPEGHADTWWRQLFNITKVEKGQRTFANEIVIDGKAILKKLTQLRGKLKRRLNEMWKRSQSK
ncbi:hypothetical protein M427DRAFT_42545 [Gonapodya prolifera JEL478]|uniref:Uncharacterized protein n=1 Tax=Gonapodya prolifera (strain JEL478) TaxID=1344416 RepID=A0A139AP89_GONPJ|nr:hypothetical protein M427DRAFT_42545 [Gonapodya prolifera JEL478]|eukprot:KXS18542.1 hypothetical protein M427DRAFT_42545 [Gonapodya prolifera JEL478]